MLTFKTGNLFDEDVEALVNTVNCVGVMGRGLALQFKRRYPDNYKAYSAACKREEVKPGAMFVYETGQLMNPRYIINFPTKRHWRSNSKIEDIESGLKALVTELCDRNISSVAIPPLGSGLGGLDWVSVKERIEASLNTLEDTNVVVFEPLTHGELAPESQTTKKPALTDGRAALLVLMDTYLGGSLDPTITLLELHKLMYFLQEAGQNLRLTYKKAIYGPYAENLRHVLNAIEGHMVTGYRDGGDEPRKQIRIVPEALAEAKAYIDEDEETRTNLQRVRQLVDGFETPQGLELLATTHWVAKERRSTSPEVVTSGIHQWNSRKRRQFSERQIGVALNILSTHGWLDGFD